MNAPTPSHARNVLMETKPNLTDLTDAYDEAADAYDEAADAYWRGMADYERGLISPHELGQLSRRLKRAETALRVARYAEVMS